ncbi:MAG: isoprenylcysteine carboxylmethyltransferase family protein [Terracidiphilus sp.]
MKDVNRNALIGLLRMVALLPALIFIPAWTLQYWQAWVCLCAFFVPVAIITAYLMRANPALLARRLKAGAKAETKKTQKMIQSFAAILFLAIFVVPTLDHRFRWSSVPVAVELGGDVLIVSGFAVVLWVFTVNSFTSGVIEVNPEQKVITSGPYAIVRHPMYLGSLVMLLGIPLSLGSWWGLTAVALMTTVIVLRLLDEEKFLRENLMGYKE